MSVLAHFWHHAILLFKRDASQSVREVGEVDTVSKLQAPKAHRLLAEAFSECKCTGAHGISFRHRRYQPIAGHESPALNPTSKPLGLALTLSVSRTINMSRLQQRVSQYRLYSLWQTVEIVGFIATTKFRSSCQKYGTSQSGPRGKMYTATTTCSSCDLLQSCLEQSRWVAHLIIQHFSRAHK